MNKLLAIGGVITILLAAGIGAYLIGQIGPDFTLTEGITQEDINEMLDALDSLDDSEFDDEDIGDLDELDQLFNQTD